MATKVHYRVEQRLGIDGIWLFAGDYKRQREAVGSIPYLTRAAAVRVLKVTVQEDVILRVKAQKNGR